jgi:hypothetical protein
MNSETGRQIKSENREVTRAAGVVGMATLLSRIFGYIRDMVLASFFGAGMAADAFIAAFRIPNLLRRLFGEGSLSIAFVPVFTEAMASGDREDGLRLAVSALKLLLVCLSVIAVVGVVAAPTIIHLVAPGFSAIPGKDGPDNDPDPHHVPLRDSYRTGGPVHGHSQCDGTLCGPGHRTGAVEPGHDRFGCCRFPAF